MISNRNIEIEVKVSGPEKYLNPNN